MSKRSGNVVNPRQVIEEVGADAVRLFLLGQSQVGVPKRFDRHQIPKVAGGFLNTLRNTYEFFAWYVRDWTAASGAPPLGQRPRADRSGLAPLDAGAAGVRAARNDSDVATAGPPIMDFARVV